MLWRCKYYFKIIIAICLKCKTKPVNIRSYEEKINDWGWKFKACSCSERLILTLSRCHVGLFFSEQVDGQKRRTGTSPGPLVGLNTFSQLYVGGYEEHTPELLPAGSRFQNSFQGSVFFPACFSLWSCLMSWFRSSVHDEISLSYLDHLCSDV